MLIGLLLLCTVLVTAATVISKSQAEDIALNAVGGGTVLLQRDFKDGNPDLQPTRRIVCGHFSEATA
jgi:hypothetical protein